MARRKYKKTFARRARRASVRVVRSARRASKTVRRYSRSNVRGSSWLPLSGREHLSAAIAGASAPVVMSWVRPYSDPMLSFAGDYKDELATYAVGALAHKFGPQGMVKEVGKDYARLAVFSASNSFFTPMLSGMSNTGTSATSANLYL